MEITNILIYDKKTNKGQDIDIIMQNGKKVVIIDPIDGDDL